MKSGDKASRRRQKKEAGKTSFNWFERHTGFILGIDVNGDKDDPIRLKPAEMIAEIQDLRRNIEHRNTKIQDLSRELREVYGDLSLAHHQNRDLIEKMEVLQATQALLAPSEEAELLRFRTLVPNLQKQIQLLNEDIDDLTERLADAQQERPAER